MRYCLKIIALPISYFCFVQYVNEFICNWKFYHFTSMWNNMKVWLVNDTERLIYIRMSLKFTAHNANAAINCHLLLIWTQIGKRPLNAFVYQEERRVSSPQCQGAWTEAGRVKRTIRLYLHTHDFILQNPSMYLQDVKGKINREDVILPAFASMADYLIKLKSSCSWTHLAVSTLWFSLQIWDSSWMIGQTVLSSGVCCRLLS